jgi:hypothetical protein
MLFGLFKQPSFNALEFCKHEIWNRKHLDMDDLQRVVIAVRASLNPTTSPFGFGGNLGSGRLFTLVLDWLGEKE